MALRGRHEPARAEEDVDALFLPESDLERGSEADPQVPQLIFTQPADRNLQQFADESPHGIAQAASAYPSLGGTSPLFAEEPEYFADELAGPAAVPDALEQTYAAHARPAPEGPGRQSGAGRRPGRMFVGTAALVALTAILVAFLAPDSRQADGQRTAPPRQAPVSAAAAPPPPAPLRTLAEPPPRVPAAGHEGSPAPAAASEATTAPSVTPIDAPRRAPSPEVADTRTGRAAPVVPVVDGPVATRETGLTPRLPQRASTPTPPASAATSSAAALPAPATVAAPSPPVPRIDAGPVTLAAPVGSSEVQLAAPGADRDRPLPARIESPPARSLPTGTGGGAAAVDVGVAERERVRALLSRYATAYSELDAAAAANVYPRVDQKALSRAFAALDAQQIRFEDCRIQVANAGARATCDGTATWTPKVGGGSRAQDRQWQFDLQQVSGEWRIGTVRVQ